MSLQTWMDEFYPVEAYELIEGEHTLKDAVLHSLRKWAGLRKYSMEKHGVQQILGMIGDNNADYLAIDADTCSLCRHYYNKCKDCILYTVNNDESCCRRHIGPNDSSPYQAFTYCGNPEPMIKLLEIALEFVDNHPEE